MEKHICKPQPMNLTKGAFEVSSQKIKQAIGIQVTFILKIKLQKLFLANSDHLSAGNEFFLNHY